MANFKFSDEFLGRLKNSKDYIQNNVENYQSIGRNIYVAKFDMTMNGLTIEVTQTKKTLAELEVAIDKLLKKDFMKQ